MRFLIVLSVVALGGCVSDIASREATIERLLARGDYRLAIVEIERGPESAEWRFSLGLLYAYREIEERGEKADFAKALQAIRAAAPKKEEARQLLADYDQRGAQVFFAFPWAHMIGPFPDHRRPEPEKKADPVGTDNSGASPLRV